MLSSLRESSNPNPAEHLRGWQLRRQKRIDAIFDWATNVTNVTRLPEEERAKLKAEGKLDSSRNDDMGWLYGYDAQEDFRDFR